MVTAADIVMQLDVVTAFEQAAAQVTTELGELAKRIEDHRHKIEALQFQARKLELKRDLYLELDAVAKKGKRREA